MAWKGVSHRKLRQAHESAKRLDEFALSCPRPWEIRLMIERAKDELAMLESLYEFTLRHGTALLAASFMAQELRDASKKSKG